MFISLAYTSMVSTYSIWCFWSHSW